jgi:hypothetical protein
LISGFLILDTGYWILDAGCWMLKKKVQGDSGEQMVESIVKITVLEIP